MCMQYIRNQGGSILVLGIVILGALSVSGVSISGLTRANALVSGGLNQYSIAKNAANSAIADANLFLRSSFSKPPYCLFNQTTPCVWAQGALSATTMDDAFWNNNGIPYAGSLSFNITPRYIIEELASDRVRGNYHYRITARGANSSTQAIITYARLTHSCLLWGDPACT